MARTAAVNTLKALILGAPDGLRWGELAALRRDDIDLAACSVKITRSLTELPDGGYHYGPPKSDAGHRTVYFPDLIAPDLTWHLARFTGPDDDALVFTSPTGSPLRRSNFRRRIWLPALRAASVPALHFHDLRHTGNSLTADAGANLRELMERMGHSSPRAALIYLHATAERQRAVADAVGSRAQAALAKTTRKPPRHGASGTDVARRRKKSS
jgi:integrase